MKRLEQNKWALMIGLFILAAFIIRLPFASMRDGFQFAFKCVAVALFAVLLFENVNKWAGLLLLLALFSHAIPFFVITKMAAINTPESVGALNSLIVGMLFYTVIVLKRPNTEVVIHFLCIIAAVNCLWLIVLHSGGDPYSLVGLKSKADPASGFMANPNESATLTVLTSAGFMRRKHFKKLLIIPIIGVVLSRSFSGYVGLSCVILIYYLITGALNIWHIISISIAGYLYIKFIDTPAVEQRLYVWKRSLTLVLENNPLLGCGLGNWKLIYPDLVKAQQFKSGYIRLHSSYVQGYVEMGIGFIAWVVGAVADTFFTLKRSDFKAMAIPITGVCAVAVTMLFNSMFRMNYLNAMVAVTWIAIFQVKNDQLSSV